MFKYLSFYGFSDDLMAVCRIKLESGDKEADVKNVDKIIYQARKGLDAGELDDIVAAHAFPIDVEELHDEKSLIQELLESP